MQVDQDEHTPEVTVVIPVYNGVDYLAEAIESVLAQTYRNFEILVVDDGSKDDTWAVVEAYMAAHPGVVRGIRKANGGIATALNTGILQARGKYFAWLSHDDRFMPTKLEKQVALLKQHPEMVGVYTDYTYIDGSGACIGRVLSAWYPQPEMLRHLLQCVFINGSTLLIQRQCLIEAGLFDETLRYAQDAMMWVHLCMRYSLAHIPEPLTEYRLHPRQTTTSTKTQAIRRDNIAWLSRAVNEYTVTQIFPELDRHDVSALEMAKAYIYLGEVFAMRYYHFPMGLQQFRRAWLAWPNLRNPVLFRSVKVLSRAVYLYLRTRRVNKRFGRKVPGIHSNAVVVDMRSWREVAKFDGAGAYN